MPRSEARDSKVRIHRALRAELSGIEEYFVIAFTNASATDFQIYLNLYPESTYFFDHILNAVIVSRPNPVWKRINDALSLLEEDMAAIDREKKAQEITRSNQKRELLEKNVALQIKREKAAKERAIVTEERAKEKAQEERAKKQACLEEKRRNKNSFTGLDIW
jgi:hypothetical protein